MYEDVFRQITNRPKDAHKYDFGHVLIIGGSPGMVGAPFLAGIAALRVGAGLVTIASTPPVIDKLERRVLEIMTLSLSKEPASSINLINDYVESRKVNVIVIGPGMDKSLTELVFSIAKKINLPTIIDGGGLGIIASNKEELKNRASTDLVLTPHMGELQRFFDKPLPKDIADILKIAKTLATDYKLNLVLKGNPTHTINRNGQVIVNDTGGPALATAGTGDVLSGMIGGIIAEGINTTKAVPAAVYLHGKAGDLAAQNLSVPSVIASDVIEFIPKAIKSLSD